MTRLADGTTYRDGPAGLIVTRGARELHLLGTSVEQARRARELLATRSFDRLFRAARRAPGMPRTAYIRV